MRQCYSSFISVWQEFHKVYWCSAVGLRATYASIWSWLTATFSFRLPNTTLMIFCVWFTYRWVWHAAAHGVRWAIGRWIAAGKAATRGANRWMKRFPVHHFVGRVHLFLELHLDVFERKLEGGKMIIALGHRTAESHFHIAYTIFIGPGFDRLGWLLVTRIMVRTCCLLAKSRCAAHVRCFLRQDGLLTAEGGRSPPWRGGWGYMPRDHPWRPRLRGTSPYRVPSTVSSLFYTN